MKNSHFQINFISTFCHIKFIFLSRNLLPPSNSHKNIHTHKKTSLYDTPPYNVMWRKLMGRWYQNPQTNLSSLKLGSELTSKIQFTVFFIFIIVLIILWYLKKENTYCLYKGFLTYIYQNVCSYNVTIMMLLSLLK